MKKTISITTLAFSVLFLTACSDPNKASEANFEKALLSYYNQKSPVCMNILRGKEMPVISQTEDKELDALVEIGLFEKTTGTTTIRPMFAVDGKREKEVDAFIYTPTKEADEYLVKTSSSFTGAGNAICFGQVNKLKVTNYTLPSEAMGITMSRVNYTFEITNIPAWAKNASLNTAFTQLKHQLNRNEDNATLILTSKGWLHERDPNANFR